MVDKDPYAQAGSRLYEKPSDLRYPTDTGSGGSTQPVTTSSPLTVCSFSDPTQTIVIHAQYVDGVFTKYVKSDGYRCS